MRRRWIFATDAYHDAGCGNGQSDGGDLVHRDGDTEPRPDRDADVPPLRYTHRVSHRHRVADRYGDRADRLWPTRIDRGAVR